MIDRIMCADRNNKLELSWSKCNYLLRLSTKIKTKPAIYGLLMFTRVILPIQLNLFKISLCAPYAKHARLLSRCLNFRDLVQTVDVCQSSHCRSNKPWQTKEWANQDEERKYEQIQMISTTFLKTDKFDKYSFMNRGKQLRFSDKCCMVN